MKARKTHKPQKPGSDKDFLKLYFKLLFSALLLCALIAAPYSFLWLYSSGDLAMERAARRQAAGNFVIFGSGVSQNFMEYKLELYKNVRPEICVIGSSRTMQFRGAWFNAPFVNMGGTAGNLAELRFAIRKMLEMGPPKALILGLDFWWFMPQWEKEPLKELDWKPGSYAYGLAELKKPWQWLLTGKISLEDFLRPLRGHFGKGFNPDRLGIMAQKYSEGFGPDGSWHNTAELTGKKPPFDYQFQDTLEQIEGGIKAFFRADEKQAGPSQEHLRALLEILGLLKERGVHCQLFIPPLSQKAYDRMERGKASWPHLFGLQKSLEEKGLYVLDFSSPKNLGSNDCEFIDGFHGGEIAYARVLLALADQSPILRKYVRVGELESLIKDWQGNAMSYNPKVTRDFEIDFNNFGCQKKTPRK